jgi:hypothetical protein
MKILVTIKPRNGEDNLLSGKKSFSNFNDVETMVNRCVKMVGNKFKSNAKIALVTINFDDTEEKEDFALIEFDKCLPDDALQSLVDNIDAGIPALN